MCPSVLPLLVVCNLELKTTHGVTEKRALRTWLCFCVFPYNARVNTFVSFTKSQQSASCGLPQCQCAMWETLTAVQHLSDGHPNALRASCGTKSHLKFVSCLVSSSWRVLVNESVNTQKVRSPALQNLFSSWTRTRLMQVNNNLLFIGNASSEVSVSHIPYAQRTLLFFLNFTARSELPIVPRKASQYHFNSAAASGYAK